MSNYNSNSRDIVKTWYKKSEDNQESNNDFDKFIYLWISFNCFFVSEFYDEAYEKRNKTIKKEDDKEEPSEGNYLSVFCENQKYKKLYADLIQNSDTFKTDLKLFKGSLQNNMFPGKVADLRPNRVKESHARKFNNIKSLKQFIFVTYQIRNNLFHGNKDPGDENDLTLVNGIFNPFFEFLTELYKKEEYLIN